jgi:hypothetical protein
MKIIQSLWSPPIVQTRDGPGNRFNGGWLDERNHWMSWALSCLTLHQFYDQVELITDNVGKKILVDQIQLPYSKVSTSLTELNGYPSKAWALGKLKAYGLQTEPFLHVDGDVYIWQKLNDSIENASLVVQSRTDFSIHPQVNELAKVIQNELISVPQAIENYWKLQQPFFAINAGIIGGKDVAFFQEYSQQAFSFIDANIDRFETLNGHLLNMVIEEHLFYCLAAELQEEITFYLGAISQPFKEVCRFHLLPYYANYVHLIGDAKRNTYASEQVVLHLREKFPEYYQRILDLFPEDVNSQDPTLYTLWPWSSKNEHPENRYSRLQKAYNWMQNHTPEQLWKTPMILSPSAHIEEKNEPTCSEFVLTFICPMEGITKMLQLEGWDLILTYFESPLSCHELYKNILEDEQIQASYQGQEHIIKDTILDVVFSFFYYYEALIIANDLNPKKNEK